MDPNEHRGEFVQSIIAGSDSSIESIAKRLHKSRSTIYNYFDKPDLEFLKIAQIGRVIGYDFSKHYPELMELKSNMIIEELAEYGKHDVLLEKAKAEIDKWKTIAFEKTNELSEWKEKYYELLQKIDKK